MEEPEDRVAYTYKIELLVHGNYHYRMHFAPGERMPESALAVQYWHSRFEPTIERATIDFLGRVPEIRAYGEVHFLSIDLYRVSGGGPLQERNWKFLKSFDEPEDVK